MKNASSKERPAHHKENFIVRLSNRYVRATHCVCSLVVGRCGFGGGGGGGLAAVHPQAPLMMVCVRVCVCGGGGGDKCAY
jgi:hypothetical protein